MSSRSGLSIFLDRSRFETTLQAHISTISIAKELVYKESTSPRHRFTYRSRSVSSIVQRSKPIESTASVDCQFATEEFERSLIRTSKSEPLETIEELLYEDSLPDLISTELEPLVQLIDDVVEQRSETSASNCGTTTWTRSTSTRYQSSLLCTDDLDEIEVCPSHAGLPPSRSDNLDTQRSKRATEQQTADLLTSTVTKTSTSEACDPIVWFVQDDIDTDKLTAREESAVKNLKYAQGREQDVDRRTRQTAISISATYLCNRRQNIKHKSVAIQVNQQSLLPVNSLPFESYLFVLRIVGISDSSARLCSADAFFGSRGLALSVC